MLAAELDYDELFLFANDEGLEILVSTIQKLQEADAPNHVHLFREPMGGKGITYEPPSIPRLTELSRINIYKFDHKFVHEVRQEKKRRQVWQAGLLRTITKHYGLSSRNFL